MARRDPEAPFCDLDIRRTTETVRAQDIPKDSDLYRTVHRACEGHGCDSSDCVDGYSKLLFDQPPQRPWIFKGV